METKDILKLIDAGFTADEIRAMLAPATDTPQDPAPEPEEKPASAPEAAPAAGDPEPAPVDPYKEAFEAINKQMAEMADNITKISKAAFMPSMGDVKPVGIEDVITRFFKEA